MRINTKFVELVQKDLLLNLPEEWFKNRKDETSFPSQTQNIEKTDSENEHTDNEKVIRLKKIEECLQKMF